jgi:hypothetical protein
MDNILLDTDRRVAPKKGAGFQDYVEKGVFSEVFIAL